MAGTVITGKMSLARLLGPGFDSRLRERGLNYFQRGRVASIAGDSDGVTAVVHGSAEYSVSLEWRDAGVAATCTCPYYADNMVCKHLWAVILAADDRGLMRPLRNIDGGLTADETDDDDLDPPEWRARVAPREYRGSRADRLQPGWRTITAKMALHPALVDAAAVNQPVERQFLYELRLGQEYSFYDALPEASSLFIRVRYRTRKLDGDWSKEKAFSFKDDAIAGVADVAERRLLLALRGSNSWSSGYYASVGLLHASLPTLLPDLCATGRFVACHPDGRRSQPLAWDDGPPWEFLVGVERDAGGGLTARGKLVRDGVTMDLLAPAIVVNDGWVIGPETVARLDHHGAFAWMRELRGGNAIPVPAAESDAFIKAVLGAAAPPKLELPPDLATDITAGNPVFHLALAPMKYEAGIIGGTLTFEYDGQIVKPWEHETQLVAAGPKRFIRRSLAAENGATVRLLGAGFRENNTYYQPDVRFRIRQQALSAAVRELVMAGWRVTARGIAYRKPGDFNLALISGIDWFELRGAADFEGAAATLPRLLAALRKREGVVVLDDGSFGILPEEWIRRYGVFAQFGSEEKDHVRFARGQAHLLDALLAAEPGVNVDESFARVRGELRRFEQIAPQAPPPSFQGALRPYQCDAMGWFDFLRRFGFGGCLADDMGLGKTVQVLALLESRRVLRASLPPGDPGRPPPSFVVVPRSLVFNWVAEAGRFAPAVRVLDHSGIARVKGTGHLDEYDVVVTTYGTLRRDVALLKDVVFDYVILDEAQAIKNATTQNAKAARLLKAGHRLALSGTPVENHLGELWSLFAFLNPGLLGAVTAFERLGAAGELEESARIVLARALKPFILRRTKQQVAADLPEKTEQTIHCDLPKAQRERYDELRDHYKAALLGKLDDKGLQRSKILILEALLRLRQAACHPGLLDPAAVDDDSAKLAALLPQITEIVEEGHKVLVFSQFVSFLAIVRRHLDKAGIAYAYLDGRVKDRQERVRRFQESGTAKLFLISLKAGGLGLNLTAADYVFLLDPWWNPAVEAQAIDRAHRIGQTRPVFAYRLIARDTVEERILELQKKKRALADAIITEDHGILRKLTRADLELLLA